MIERLFFAACMAWAAFVIVNVALAIVFGG
jgi:hypothetical protein